MATNIIASVGAARCLHIQGPQVRQPLLQLQSRKKPAVGRGLFRRSWKPRNPFKLRPKSPGRFGQAPSEEKVRTYNQSMLGCGSAGVTPFVVAGIEFSKRIAAQQRCSVCGGSGLVKKSGSYFRCGNCGGFLPWYSWRRFFKG